MPQREPLKPRLAKLRMEEGRLLHFPPTLLPLFHLYTGDSGDFLYVWQKFWGIQALSIYSSNNLRTLNYLHIGRIFPRGIDCVSTCMCVVWTGASMSLLVVSWAASKQAGKNGMFFLGMKA